MYEFPATGAVEAEIRLSDGRLDITTQPGLATVTVSVEPMDGSEASRDAAERTTVEMHGTKLTIKSPDIGTTGWLRGRRSGKIAVTATLPAESRVELRSASADAKLQGVYGDVAINTASGDTFVETVTGSLSINAASGDVSTTHVGGDLKVNSASGDVHAEQVDGTLSVHTASGDVQVGSVGKGAKANTASGDITIARIVHGSAKINSASGDIQIGISAGTSVYMDVSSMSGRARSELDTSHSPAGGNEPEVVLHVRSMSGDITVKRS